MLAIFDKILNGDMMRLRKGEWGEMKKHIGNRHQNELFREKLSETRGSTNKKEISECGHKAFIGIIK